MREIEIKMKVADLDTVIERLRELGGTISESVTQTDINFIHRDDIKWYEPLVGVWVYPRLRIQQDIHGARPLRFTVKRPLQNESDCREYEIEIDNADELRGMMDLFGYKEGVTVKKVRRTCELGGYSLTIDEVERLGNFIEIERVIDEGQTNQSAEQIQTEMLNFAERTLGLLRDSLELRGYDIQLYYAK